MTLPKKGAFSFSILLSPAPRARKRNCRQAQYHSWVQILKERQSAKNVRTPGRPNRLAEKRRVPLHGARSRGPGRPLASPVLEMPSHSPPFLLAPHPSPRSLPSPRFAKRDRVLLLAVGLGQLPQLQRERASAQYPEAIHKQDSLQVIDLVLHHPRQKP